jgi:hypothetical protein
MLAVQLVTCFLGTGAAIGLHLLPLPSFWRARRDTIALTCQWAQSAREIYTVIMKSCLRCSCAVCAKRYGGGVGMRLGKETKVEERAYENPEFFKEL